MSPPLATVTVRHVFWRWLGVVSLGQVAGLTMPLTAALVVADRVDGWPRLLVLFSAGAGGGALLGWAQALVLRGLLSDLRHRDWVVRTAFAAGVAWSIGLAPTAVEPVWQQWPGAMQAMAALDALAASPPRRRCGPVDGAAPPYTWRRALDRLDGGGLARRAAVSPSSRSPSGTQGSSRYSSRSWVSSPGWEWPWRWRPCDRLGVVRLLLRGP